MSQKCACIWSYLQQIGTKCILASLCKSRMLDSHQEKVLESCKYSHILFSQKNIQNSRSFYSGIFSNPITCTSSSAVQSAIVWIYNWVTFALVLVTDIFGVYKLTLEIPGFLNIIWHPWLCWPGLCRAMPLTSLYFFLGLVNPGM